MNRKENDSLQNRMLGFMMNNKALVILAVLMIGMSFATDSFLTAINLRNLMRQICVSTTLSIGFTIVIASGKIDLSVGSMLGLLGIIMAHISLRFGLAVALVSGIGLGAFFGFINGFISSKFKLNPFIVTLATQQIFKGVGYLLCNNTPVSGLSDGFKFIGQGYIGPVPVPVIILIVATAAAAILLYATKFGRHVIAIGGNAEAARVSGVNVGLTSILVYVVVGIYAAVAAMIMTGRVASAQPSAGTGMEMDAICAVVLGGTSMAGGKGKIIGTVLGCLTVGTINNGLNLLRVDSNWQLIAKGALIIFAIIIDVQTENFIKMREKRGGKQG